MIPDVCVIDLKNLKPGDYVELVYEGETIGQWKLCKEFPESCIEKYVLSPTFFMRKKNDI